MTPGSTQNRLIQAAAHAVLFSLIFLGAHWVLVGHKASLSREFFGLLGLGVAVAGVDGWIAAASSGISSLSKRIGGFALACLVGWILARGWFSPGAWVFVLGVGLLAGVGFQRLRRTPLICAVADSWSENSRLVLLAVVALWLSRPFFESEFFGAVDARSYGYTMVDVLQQARAGVFPVFVSQSEFMFNGAIHPIRTAPYHHYLGIALDQVTFRALTPLAIQHLTMVVTVTQAALICYLSLLWIGPRHRWLAWIMAILYVSSPATCGYIYGQEMYMTFMTFGWLPLVLIGNVRLIRNDDALGWIWLAAGLALVWVAHAPVALWLSIGSLGIQFLRLVIRDFSWSAWRRATGGALLFCGLTAYYFWSMAEVSQAAGPSSNGWIVAVILFGAGVVGTARFVVTMRWAWLAGAVGLAAGLRFINFFYADWLGLVLGLSVVWVGLNRFAVFAPVRRRLPELMLLLLLLGGLLLAFWRPAAADSPALAWIVRTFPQNLLPVSAYAQQLTDLQLGYALWLAVLVGGVAGVLSSSLERRLIALVALVWVALILPVPGLSRLLLLAVPEQLYAVSSDITWLRYLPTMVVLAVFAGFMGLSASFERFKISRLLAGVAAVVALGWSFAEAEKFVRCGFRNTNTPETIKAFYRPELVRQFSYIFHGLPVSPYLTNGVIDYQLESRLLRIDDPQRESVDAVDFAGARETALTTKADATSPHWLYMEPQLNLAPGERLLLRFEFLERNYAGTLIFRGPDGFYRDYPMPAAGFFAKSFGVEPTRPKTIALWNTGSKPQPVELVFLRSELPADGQEFGEFARLKIQKYEPKKLPVHTESLIPYRAQIRSAEAVWLETPRAFIPGYRALVNGRDAEVVSSPNNMAMFKVPAGNVVVQLNYVGTRALWLAMTVSAVVWLGVFATWLGLSRKKSPARAA